VPGYGEQVYGQRINRIVPNSPAFHAGLEAGDVIINANGYAMDSRQQLQAAINTSQGYLEMQVLDSRSHQLVWVVAQTDSQGGGPLAAARPQSFSGRNAQVPSRTGGMRSNGRQNPNPSFYRSNGRSGGSTHHGSVRSVGTMQTRSALSTQGVGGRRPPVGRR
jgi:membrane-associated protease RseP (regulator of RpoE activity)